MSDFIKDGELLKEYKIIKFRKRLKTQSIKNLIGTLYTTKISKSRNKIL